MVTELAGIINNVYMGGDEDAVFEVVYDMIHDAELIEDVRIALKGSPALRPFNRAVNALQEDM